MKDFFGETGSQAQTKNASTQHCGANVGLIRSLLGGSWLDVVLPFLPSEGATNSLGAMTKGRATVAGDNNYCGWRRR